MRSSDSSQVRPQPAVVRASDSSEAEPKVRPQPAVARASDSAEAEPEVRLQPAVARASDSSEAEPEVRPQPAVGCRGLLGGGVIHWRAIAQLVVLVEAVSSRARDVAVGGRVGSKCLCTGDDPSGSNVALLRRHEKFNRAKTALAANVSSNLMSAKLISWRLRLR